MNEQKKAVAPPPGASAGREEEIRARCDAATPGPWAFAQTGEKCYCANVAAGVFAEEDERCERPLSGDLTEREDNYYVDEPICEMEHQRCAYDAAFIAHARADVPWLLAQLAESRSALAAERAAGAAMRDTLRDIAESQPAALAGVRVTQLEMSRNLSNFLGELQTRAARALAADRETEE